MRQFFSENKLADCVSLINEKPQTRINDRFMGNGYGGKAESISCNNGGTFGKLCRREVGCARTGAVLKFSRVISAI